MPVGDWQFWVVTLLALAGLLFVVRLVLPRKRKSSGRRVTLTVDKRRL